MNSLERWKKAILHLECPTDRLTAAQDLERLLSRFEENLDTITEEEWREVLKEVRDPRHSGTAVFFVHKDLRYLVTARHVVYDKVVAQEWNVNRIYSLIFRAPSLDEFLSWSSLDTLPNPFSKQLRAVHPQSYTLSNLDLAVISLDWGNSEFADELLLLGYVPLTMNDIADEPSAEGVEVFTVGYLGATSLLEPLKGYLPLALHPWVSTFASLPTFSFGRVSMLHHHLPSFWCDMSVYPGNSGGPVIENDKLVGIVSAQAQIESAILDRDERELPYIAETRIPFGNIVKGKYVRELLETQIGKDTAAKPS